MQSLIWAVITHSEIPGRSKRVQNAAKSLLTRDERRRLGGGVLGLLPDSIRKQLIQKVSPTLRQVLAGDTLRRLLNANAPYEEMERVAVLDGDRGDDVEIRTVPRGRWSYHARGFFLRYLPGVARGPRYRSMRVDLYVPEDFSLQRDRLGRIATVLDRRGNRVDIEYTSDPPRSVEGDRSVHAYAFRSFRMAGPDMPVVKPVRRTAISTAGWTLVGVPRGDAVVRPARSGRETAERQRYQVVAGLLHQIPTIEREFGRRASPDGLVGDLIDLAHLRLAVEAVLKGTRRAVDGTERHAAVILTHAWQSLLHRWLGGQTEVSSVEYDPLEYAAIPGRANGQGNQPSPRPIPGDPRDDDPVDDSPDPGTPGGGDLFDALTVLACIKAEAQTRAEAWEFRPAPSGDGSLARSQFFRVLSTEWLKEYLRSPRTETQETIRFFAERNPLGDPTAENPVIRVPRAIRRQDSWIPDVILPSTAFYGGGWWPKQGRYYRQLPLLDVEYLVGEPNRGVGTDADWTDGGKNTSNVMHWATGIALSQFKSDAVREIFLGYELWHLEGWDVFGEDAINDLIAEEQGRLFGQWMWSNNSSDPIAKRDLLRQIDFSFRAARAWIGTLIGLRSDTLNGMIILPVVPRATRWWNGNDLRLCAPWTYGDGKSIRQLLKEGQTPNDLCSRSEGRFDNELVEHLAQIYTLIFEAERWRRDIGPIDLTLLQKQMLAGIFNAQFKAAPKAWNAPWELRIEEEPQIRSQPTSRRRPGSTRP